MTRDVVQSRDWVKAGTETFLAHVESLSDDELSGPSLLPGWTRKHVAAHVAANAEALCNLLHWAQTGDRTPMYTSGDQRNADIAKGATLAKSRLTPWLAASAFRLEVMIEGMPRAQWSAEVVSATGRPISASEVVWLRAREVCIHAVDLATGLTFADLPRAFLEALVVDIKTRRGVGDLPAGALADHAAYLAGRPHALVGAPVLGPWL